MDAHPNSINLANTLSDHNAQVDEAAKVVSQNLQGPYAIVLSGQPQNWTFDLPERIDLKKPNYEQLSKMTGLSVAQCKHLVNLMTQRPPTISKETMRQELGKFGIGDSLGQGRHRISIETDKSYEIRMRAQIRALSVSVDGGANVLSLQEQPYDGIDDKRIKIFERVMEELGYISVARLDGRDVGIWVKQDLYHNFKEPSNKDLVKMVATDPFKGCIVEGNGYLYINLHAYTRVKGLDMIAKLIELKQAAEQYANGQSPKLQIIINGDMNLFMLNPVQQDRLRQAGFVVEPVKGQELFATPTCEAYLLAPRSLTQSFDAPDGYRDDRAVAASIDPYQIAVARYCTHIESLVLGIGVKPIDVIALEKYKISRSKSGSGFTLFGGFPKTDKVEAVNKLINAVMYYNQHHSMDNFQGGSLQHGNGVH